MITAGDIIAAQAMVPGAPPLFHDDAARAAERIATLFEEVNAGRADPEPARGRGRPRDFHLQRLFRRLADVFEELTERPATMTIDPATGASSGAILAWAAHLFSLNDELRQWAASNPTAAANHLKAARAQALDIDQAEILNRTGDLDLTYISRPRRGRSRK
ncbi:hypothetical protein [Acidiphilium sp.]|uniref:hypothetical protein n=1 Tax=Acidiphilium sp. TaxID=527 RepID=UPI0025909824|nr:hypothetical protein [Acidiphilium sp.]